MAWGDRAAAHPDSILKCEIEEVTLSRQNIFIEYLIFFTLRHYFHLPEIQLISSIHKEMTPSSILMALLAPTPTLPNHKRM